MTLSLIIRHLRENYPDLSDTDRLNALYVAADGGTYAPLGNGHLLGNSDEIGWFIQQ